MSPTDQPKDDCGIEEQYLSVKERVWRTAQKCEREPASITLVAVTKTFQEREILPVLIQGHRVFGENRVQEAVRKWPPLREHFPTTELHLIGPLQSNKVREAVAFFDCIHTLDRPKLAEALSTEIKRQGRQLKLFVQVNTGLEPQKAGVAPAEAEKFVNLCRQGYGLPIHGLMCIPPFQEDPVPHFELLGALRHSLALQDLSMGMSADYEDAIAHGATILRVGSAIFGNR